MRHIRLFQYLDAIVREGSVRRAADRLFITASALDRRLQDLEEELETPIFERHPRGMRLTSAGELLMGYVRRHLSDMQRLRSEIDSLKGLRRGQISLAVSPALAADLVPRAVADFRAQYPGVSFRVTVTEHAAAIRALLNFDVDLAVIVAPPEHPDVFVLAVSHQPLMAAMDRGHPLAGRQDLRLGDCLQYPLVLPAEGLTTRQMLETALNRHRSGTRIAVETNSYEILRGLLQGTENIGFVLSAGARGGETGNTVYRPVSTVDIRPVPIICAQLRNRGLPVAAARFSESMGEEMRSLSGTP